MSQRSHLDASASRRVVFRIGEGMYQAHYRSVAIGNLKSTNILLNESYEPYLSPRTRNIFLLHYSVGERLVPLEDPVYTAPDVLCPTGGQSAPFELSNQYSLGVLAYKLFTGDRPATLPVDTTAVEADQLEAACQLIERRGDAAYLYLPDVRERRPEVPSHVSAIVRRMVSLDQEKRYPRLNFALGALITAARFDDFDRKRRDEIAIAWRELMKPVARYFRRKSRSTG